MQDKIFEIIMYLLNEIKNHKKIQDVDIQSLMTNGYTDSEISTAFEWVLSNANKLEIIYEGTDPLSKSKRLLHKSEKQLLSIEAEGFLIMMMELNILNEFDIDLLLEMLNHYGIKKASLKELKSVIAPLILGADYKYRNKNRIMLQRNDTIH